MKRIIVLIIISYLFNSAALANNQIAYIDMDRILNTSKIGKKAVTNLEENQKSLKQLIKFFKKLIKTMKKE